MSTKEFRISDPGALIAALPGLFGFIPEQSLSVVLMKGRDLVSGMRIDLTDAYHAHDRLSAVAGEHGDAVVVIISDTTPRAAHHKPLIESLQVAFASNGVALVGAYVTNGETWWCPINPTNNGAVADIRESELVCAAVMDGRVVNRTRADMVAALAPTGVQVTDDELDEAVAYDAVELITAITGGAVDFARLAVTLLDGELRDKVYGLAVSKTASTVEALFVSAARVLPGEYRADALTVVGFFAYCRGDGAYAGMALEMATQLNPQQKMANMLDTALQSGIHPSKIRMLAEKGAAATN